MGENRARKCQFRGNACYLAAPELCRAVNAAMALEKPLLIKGEPGSGKTALAQAVAESLNLPLLVWNVKSTTQARDGLYCYDVVQRLYDSQFGRPEARQAKGYIELGMLGKALSSGEPSVLLIDEIDKANIEFPGDLLWELGQMRFRVEETGEVMQAKHPPLVIITSNSEKELPASFERQCLFHYILFPEPEEMKAIVAMHLPEIDSELLERSLDVFYWIRSLTTLQKKPGTSELLDWLKALSITETVPETVDWTIPYPGVLLKREDDLEKVQQYHIDKEKYKKYHVH